MLIIGDHQINALKAERMDRFIRTTLSDLSEIYEEKILTRGEAPPLEKIANFIHKAQAFGLRSERDLFLYCSFCLEYGGDFDKSSEFSWVLLILKDEAGEKMSRVFDMLIEKESDSVEYE